MSLEVLQECISESCRQMHCLIEANNRFVLTCAILSVSVEKCDDIHPELFLKFT